MNLVSVIIPVYNVEKYIQECVNSVLNQSYENLEIIIVDDGSTDHSALLCDTFTSDKRVRVFHNENSGLSKARQFGIDNAHGEYFVTIDSDDYIDQLFVEKLHKAASMNNADIAVCARVDFNERSSWVVKLNHTQDLICTTQNMVTRDMMSLRSQLCLSDSWNKLYRTSFVYGTRVKFNLPNQYNGTDLIYNHKLLLYCPKYVVVDVPLLYHRQVQGSRVRRKDKPLQQGFQLIITELIEEAKKLNYSPQIIQSLYNVYFVLLVYVVMDVAKYANSLMECKEKYKDLLVMYNDFSARYDGFNNVYQYEYNKSFYNGLIERSLSKRSLLGLQLSALIYRLYQNLKM